MMKHQEFMTLPRSASASSVRGSRKIIPATTHLRSSSTTALSPETDGVFDKLLTRSRTNHHSPVTYHNFSKTPIKLSSIFRSLLNILSFPAIFPTCKWLTIPSQLSITPSLGRKVTGTLFGNRRGHVSFAVQLDPRSEPVLLLELAMSTASLVKEMASGLVRIALESEKLPAAANGAGRKLFQEPTWTMYCNGRRCGYAVSRTCGESDSHVLSTVRSVSVGAGVIPVVDDEAKRSESEGELLYMRARFERVVGSRDSEAFYMMNPDGNGGPELSIFLLRL
ncbi:protein MIZU-KUSSEI 1 [Humulus lupulus]|uniref:protein MIZU-KUSSEI 1 n=1 Tax=Humulus lupulus TaxID=3486 RepID=UPI002B418636|nr:protein MIZU-KUSSEI 1 [Humulus lupulus]